MSARPLTLEEARQRWLTYREASAKVLVILFGVKVPMKRSRVRVEKLEPLKLRESRWDGRSQVECLRKISEVCERNKTKAAWLPAPLSVAAPGRPRHEPRNQDEA